MLVSVTVGAQNVLAVCRWSSAARKRRIQTWQVSQSAVSPRDCVTNQRMQEEDDGADAEELVRLDSRQHTR